MAQKVVGYVKLQIPAGKATPAPPVGPALGQHGINIAAFTNTCRITEFNGNTVYIRKILNNISCCSRNLRNNRFFLTN